MVATASYTDPTLAKLRAPGGDASDLAAVLEDAAIGGFEVEMVLDAPAKSLQRRIAQFCAQVGPGDLALVYLSCHGVLDDRGRLYYATADTDRALLSATAVSATWLNEQLEDCRCRRQILVLDCCHSGAFAKGAKGESDLALRGRFEGRGRVVLTGSRGTEYSFEHDRVVDDSASSVFTSALVEGLRSGDADRDGDGMVTVNELYDYAYEAVRTRESRQTPMLWTYGAEGNLLVAHSPRGAVVEPAPLPEDLLVLLESARSRVREGAVTELADLLTGPDAGRALTARAELERIAAEDVPGVAAAARAALDAAPAAAEPNPPGPGTPAPPSPPSTPAPPPPPSTQGPPASPGPPSPYRRRRAIAVAAGAIAVAIAAAAVALMGGGGEEHSLPPGPKIAVSGSPRGIAVGDDALWVTRYEEGEVSKIDSSGPESIAVGPRPGKIVAGEGSVWVSYEDGGKLARIDPGTSEVTEKKTVDTPACNCAISELAIAHNTLWVGSENQGTITMRDLSSGEPVGAPYHLDRGFEGVFAVGDDAVWAVGNDSQERAGSWLTRIDLDSGTVDRSYSRGSSYFSGVAYGEGTVWIADAGNDRNVVAAYEPETEGVAKNIEVENGVFGDDIAVAGGRVTVWTPPEGGWLTRIDAETMRVVKPPRKVPGFPPHLSVAASERSDLAVDENSAWVTDPAGEAVYRVDY
jgi:hypothetical protein